MQKRKPRLRRLEGRLREAFDGSPHIFTTPDAVAVAYDGSRVPPYPATYITRALREFATPLGRSDQWPGRPMLWQCYERTD